MPRALATRAMGLGAALPAAAQLTKTMSGLLYRVKPLHPITFAVMSLLLIAVSAVASFVPALRAATVDPARTLRSS